MADVLGAVGIFAIVFVVVWQLGQGWIDTAPDTPGFRWRRPRL